MELKLLYPTRPSIYVLICVLYYSTTGKYISWFDQFIITEFDYIYCYILLDKIFTNIQLLF